MVNGAGHWSLCVTAHYDYFCKTAIIGKSLSWDIKNGAISQEKLSYKRIFSGSAGPFSGILRLRVAELVTLRFFAKRLFFA